MARKTIQDIFDMLDLFYANIHLYKKIIRRKENEDEENAKYQSS